MKDLKCILQFTYFIRGDYTRTRINVGIWSTCACIYSNIINWRKYIKSCINPLPQYLWVIAFYSFPDNCNVFWVIKLCCGWYSCWDISKHKGIYFCGQKNVCLIQGLRLGKFHCKNSQIIVCWIFWEFNSQTLQLYIPLTYVRDHKIHHKLLQNLKSRI